jgi:VWFA-related protein
MRFVCPTLTAFALAATLVAAQDGVQSNIPGAGFDTPSPSTPTLHVYSRETIVDVLVTDDKGQPVRGLKQSDFTVKEDGHPQPIRSFHEYTHQAPPASVPALPPNTYTNATTLPTTGPVQIFLFDVQATPPAVMERAKKYIAEYLRSMPSGTNVAIFDLSPLRHLRLLQGFTTDGALAAEAVEKLDVEWIRNPVPTTRRAIAALNDLAVYLAGMHGRKNLIWVVPSPLLILRDGGLSWRNLDMTIVHRLMDLYDLFTKEQIAIYPFDPRGVHGANLEAQAVADGTGGATSNSNDYKATLTKIVVDSSHGYTISYVPPRPDTDGHFHPITISVDRPRLHLNYRTGYNDEQPHPPDAILKLDMIQGPMRLGAMPATQLIFQMNVQPAATPTPQLKPVASEHPTPHTKGSPYNVLFQLDPTQLAYTEAPDGNRTCSLEFDLGAYDAYSQLVTARSQTLKITVTPAQYAVFTHKPFHFTLPIDLPHGQLNLRAGVFDTSANKAGTLEVPLIVPKR